MSLVARKIVDYGHGDTLNAIRVYYDDHDSNNTNDAEEMRVLRELVDSLDGKIIFDGMEAYRGGETTVYFLTQDKHPSVQDLEITRGLIARFIRDNGVYGPDFETEIVVEGKGWIYRG